jgi:hypothetical protein
MTQGQYAHKILRRVKKGINFAKWGNLDENVLNGVISVDKSKLGVKKWNFVGNNFEL